MLYLTRKPPESIIINYSIEMILDKVSGDIARLGIVFLPTDPNNSPPASGPLHISFGLDKIVLPSLKLNPLFPAIYVSTKIGETIKINDSVTISVQEIQRQTVKFGFEFPPEVSILRRELWEKDMRAIEKEKAEL